MVITLSLQDIWPFKISEYTIYDIPNNSTRGIFNPFFYFEVGVSLVAVQHSPCPHLVVTTPYLQVEPQSEDDPYKFLIVGG